MKYGKNNKIFSALFIIKTFVCLILIRLYAGTIVFLIMAFIMQIFDTFLPSSIISLLDGSSDSFFVTFFIYFFIIFLLFNCFLIYGLVFYFFFKIFGIFKDVEKFNSFKKEILYILLLLLIASFLYAVVDWQTHYDFVCSLLGLGVLLAYILYKFFQYLTKKFPKPFNKIGYYSSIEFYKSLAVKIKNKFKSKIK